MTNPTPANFEALPAELRLEIYNMLFDTTTRNNWNGIRLANKACKAEVEDEFHKRLVIQLKGIAASTANFSIFGVSIELPTTPQPTYGIKFTLGLRDKVKAIADNPTKAEIQLLEQQLLTLDVNHIILTLETGGVHDDDHSSFSWFEICILRSLRKSRDGFYRRSLFGHFEFPRDRKSSVLTLDMPKLYWNYLLD